LASSEIKIRSGTTFLIAASVFHVARASSSAALSALQSFFLYSWASQRRRQLNPGCYLLRLGAGPSGRKSDDVILPEMSKLQCVFGAQILRWRAAGLFLQILNLRQRSRKAWSGAWEKASLRYHALAGIVLAKRL